MCGPPAYGPARGSHAPSFRSRHGYAAFEMTSGRKPTTQARHFRIAGRPLPPDPEN